MTSNDMIQPVPADQDRRSSFVGSLLTKEKKVSP